MAAYALCQVEMIMAVFSPLFFWKGTKEISTKELQRGSNKESSYEVKQTRLTFEKGEGKNEVQKLAHGCSSSRIELS